MGSYNGILTPPDQNTDWSDDSIYQSLPPWLRQNYLATFSPGQSAAGKNDIPVPSSPLSRVAPGSYRSVAAGGPAGLGTNQPHTEDDGDTSDRSMQGAAELAGQTPDERQTLEGLIRRGPAPATPQTPPMPPPGAAPIQANGTMPPPQAAGSMPPPGMNPQATGSASATGSSATLPNLNPAIQRDADVLNQPLPTKRGGAMGVIQRLGMALFSASKLAPYAQQIIYPKYSAQMNQRTMAENELKELSSAQETMGRGAMYQSYAEGGRQKPIVGKDGTIYVPDGKGGWTVQQPAMTPMDRKMQAMQLGLDEDTANAYALGLKPEEVKTVQPVDWYGLTPQLQQLYRADPNGKARVPTALIERTIQQATPTTAAMTPERIGQFNQLLAARFQGVHPNVPVPPYMQLAPNASLEDYQNVEKAVSGLEGQAGTLANQQAAQQLRQQTFQLAQMEAQRRAEEAKQKEEQTERTLAEKVYSPVQDSAERFNVMAQNYEDAVGHNDQQAMLSLLYNHLGMTMGLQKGARMTQALIQEAMKSRPWLQGMTSKFDKDGYLSGVTLTPEQMRQMVGNAQGRFNQDAAKAKSSADFIGLKNGGPTRIPNEATKRYYLHLAQNDPGKATQLMLTDGWKPQ